MIEGIHVIDTGFHRPRFDAAYLIVENDRGAFIDSGTTHSVPVLLDALAGAGLQPADVDWLILTHVHLDHAGGAGALLEHLPNARVIVHARGARHMIDPSRLIAGATAVYGEEEMARSYGTIVPMPDDRVKSVSDGDSVELAGRRLVFLDTPGHAAHHICIWDARSRHVFSGDTFGIAYHELDGPGGPYVFPTTTPVQFDPEAMKASINRLLALEPDGIFVTHFGRVTGLQEKGEALRRHVDAFVEAALAVEMVEDRHAALRTALDQLLVGPAARHSGLDEVAVRKLLDVDIELNAQGLGVWLDRRRRRLS